MELINSEYPIGRQFNCSFGYFDLPSAIIGVDIFSDGIIFYCDDGKYFAYTKDPKSEFFLKKIEEAKEKMNQLRPTSVCF